MSNKVDEFLPLARVGTGVTLSSSPAKDKYYLVNANGAVEKIPLNRASYLYIQAKEKGTLLWNRVPKKRKSKSAEPTQGEAWRKELREKLGYKDEP